MERARYEARAGLDRQSILKAFSKTLNPGFDIELVVRGGIAAVIKDGFVVTVIPETVELA